MTAISKATLKEMLGELPLTAELYWHLRQSDQAIEPGFSLERLQTRLPSWASKAADAAQQAPRGRKVFLFATLRYWIEHASLLGLALAGLGHQVSLAYLPYTHWKKPLSRFDLRRQNVYARSVLELAKPLLRIVPLLDTGKNASPAQPELVSTLEELALRDTRYTLQVEEVDQESELYRMRLERDIQAAQAAYYWLENHRPDVVLIPNGSILEFGAVYLAAQRLGIPLVTYEFGEQRKRIWLAQNSAVMQQDTDALWQARRDYPLNDAQWEQMRTLFAARQGADLWANFSRRWQGAPGEGGEAVRAGLGLDGRPVVLLATNVIGDSLTLGRQIFTPTMSDWIIQTMRYFTGRQDAQLVVRIHPGEQITRGPSVAELIRQDLPELSEHIHLIPADAPVNTYDLVEIADLGLVYTTTVGLEMAMSGAPVIVAGSTHYRGKGFTHDPDSEEVYWNLLERILVSPAAFRLSHQQVMDAWTYAYRFFFDYPRPFPWQLLHMWEELEDWPLERVLSPEGEGHFGDTFRYLVGDPLDWGHIRAAPGPARQGEP